MSSHTHDDGGEAHGSFKGYMTGFVLAAILTIIPFWLVMSGVIDSKTTTGLIILGFAVVQIVVHMVYFLHMSPRSEDGWTMMALIFTLTILLIVIAGSLWIMYHLDTNMMPPPPMSAMP